MNKKELLAELEKYPDDMPIVIADEPWPDCFNPFGLFEINVVEPVYMGRGLPREVVYLVRGIDIRYLVDNIFMEGGMFEDYALEEIPTRYLRGLKENTADPAVVGQIDLIFEDRTKNPEDEPPDNIDD